MAEILIYNAKGERMAKTSRAFDIYVQQELMRGYTLDFALANNDNARAYITSGAVFEVEGQKYDITGFNNSSGTDNITSIRAEHISYRLNNYVIPEGFFGNGYNRRDSTGDIEYIGCSC